MKKILVLLLAASLSMFMFGCAANDAESTEEEAPAENQSTEAEESTPQDIEVIESAYYVDEHDTIYYALHLKNPNSNFEAYTVPIKVTSKDADGNIVLDNETYFSMQAGADLWYGDRIEAEGTPETVEFNVQMSDSDWLENDTPYEPSYEIANTKVVESETGVVTFEGEITVLNEAGSNNNARLSAVLKDASGKAIGGCYGTVDVKEVGETVPFEIFAGKAPEYETYEITATPVY